MKLMDVHRLPLGMAKYCLQTMGKVRKRKIHKKKNTNASFFRKKKSKIEKLLKY